MSNKSRYPNLPFRDQIWRINFQDGRDSAYLSTYNGEITGWTDNVPDDLKKYSSNFNVYVQYQLSSQGMAFFNEGPNELRGTE